MSDNDELVQIASFVDTSISREYANGGSFSCAFCARDLGLYTVPQREQHYEQHLPNTASNSASSSSRHSNPGHKPAGSPRSKKRKWGLSNFVRPTESDVFWFPAKSGPPPGHYTPNLIPLLRRALIRSHSRGVTRRAVLCYDRTVHIRQGLWDATWGCGHRNFMMLCAALMDQKLQPLYHPLLDKPLSPSVRNLQMWIEAAWQAGFDKEGAEQLKNLVGTRKWIGTADLWVAFSFCGIPAQLVDFNDLKKQPRGVDMVLDWIISYFSPKLPMNTSTNALDALRGASPVISTEYMPIVLQHAGHSRTIIGYEVSKSGAINLLTFDPGFHPNRELRSLALASFAEPLQHFYPSHSGPKRPRSDIEPQLMGDDDIVCIGESKARQRVEAPKVSTGDTPKGKGVDRDVSPDILKHFRVGSKKLGKDQYQILYFPMTAPLTEVERLGRKTVTSTRIC